MAKRICLLLSILFLFFLSPVEVSPSSIPDITITPPIIGQGEVSLLTIGWGKGAKPAALWMGERITVVYNNKNEIWSGFIGADLTTKPGRYTLQTSLNNNPYLKTISVVSRDHGVRHLTVPKEMEALDIDTLKRVREESRRTKEVFIRSADYSLWRGKWIRPVPGMTVSPFGCRCIINDMERSPHSGVDLKAAEGTPVKATNRGKVVLVANHFFSGLSIIIDHGGGIQSMYFHLSKDFVKMGQLVKKGTIIGLAGSSGRVTGPHLHFGIRLNGGRIDPIKLIEISEGLER